MGKLERPPLSIKSMDKDDTSIPLMDKMKYPNRLAWLRKRSRLTQEEVAKIIGYDFTTISRHETGDRRLDAEDIKKYSRLFKVETYEIFQEPLPDKAVAK